MKITDMDIKRQLNFYRRQQISTDNHLVDSHTYAMAHYQRGKIVMSDKHRSLIEEIQNYTWNPKPKEVMKKIIIDYNPSCKSPWTLVAHSNYKSGTDSYITGINNEERVFEPIPRLFSTEERDRLSNICEDLKEQGERLNKMQDKIETMKFRKGDTVERICNGAYYTKGLHYIVERVNNDCTIRAEDDDGDLSCSYTSNFKLIKRKEMRKEDLKTGMVVEYGEGELLILCENHNNELIGLDEEGCLIMLANYNDNLEGPCQNINKIYSRRNESYMALDISTARRSLLWQREEEITELTIEEIAEKFGKDVKSIRIKD